MGNKVKLKIGHLRITDHLILGVTHDKLKTGKESFQYCDIEPIAMTGWNSIGEALVNGEIDVAFMLAPYAMEMFHSGLKIKLTLLSHKSGSIIVTNSRANIEKVEDFKGKTVLIPYHLSIHHMLIDKLFNDHGLKTGIGKDVIFEVVAPSQIPDAIEWDEEGEIGGYIVAEPWGTKVIQAGYGKLFSLSKDIWPKHPCCVMVVSEAILGKYPDAINELVTSLVDSGNFVQENAIETIKIGASFFNLEEEVIKGVLTGDKDKLITNELMPQLDDFEKIQTYLTENISAMSGKIDLEKFVDLKFATAAKAK